MTRRTDPADHVHRAGGRSPGPATVERARLIRRENRFVARVARDDGAEVRAYVPNTGRLEDLLVPGATVVLTPSDDPRRATRWTLTRVWDDAWVALDAAAPARLVADHLDAGGALGPWAPPVAVRREVPHGRHRFDLESDLADGRTAVVEVKSLTSASGGVAPLSSTPSARGTAHLAALGAMAQAGTPTAVVLVVQRGDVEAVDLDAPAAPTWVTAVRAARTAGVVVVAYGCEVDEASQRLGPPLVVRACGAPPQAEARAERAQATTATTTPR